MLETVLFHEVSSRVRKAISLVLDKPTDEQKKLVGDLPEVLTKVDRGLAVVDRFLSGEEPSDAALALLVDQLHGTWNEVVEFAVDLDELFSSTG